MTAFQFHHAQTSIEEALSSAQYGERMIRLADQFRREGNHDAADAAFVAAAQIRYTLCQGRSKTVPPGRSNPGPPGRCLTARAGWGPPH